MDDLRYPIGRFERPAEYTPALRSLWMSQFAAAPPQIREGIAGLTPPQLATPYRDGGWTPVQVVHHLVDSHLNSYVRFKLALTEEAPTVSDYNESAWAEMADAKSTSGLESSLKMLEVLHARFLSMMRAMSDEDWKRTFVHPKHGPRTLELTLAIYAWHGRHHAAHITSLRTRMGW